jgi:hypothetical protein
MYRLLPTRILAIVLLAGGVALRSVGLTAPFGADNPGFGGGFFSIIGRNYARYGYLATAVVPVITPGPPPAPPAYYAHHPPLFGLLLSVSFAVFGVSEWSARLVPLTFAGAGLVLLYRLARQFYGERVALITLAVAATMPLDAHLAAHVDLAGSVLLALVLAAIASLARARYGAFLAFFTLAALTDWPAFYLPALLAVAPWPFAFPRSRRFAGGLLLYAAGLFAVLVVWCASGGTAPLAFASLVKDRALSFASDERTAFSLADWLRVVGGYLWTLCTPAVLGMTAIWAAWRVPGLVRRRDLETPDPERLTLLLLAFGVLHVVIGFQGAYQHDFWSVYLGPGVSLACALVLERVMAAARQRAARVAVLAGGLALIMGPGLYSSLRLVSHPLTARALDADYSPREIGEAIRDCTPPHAGALTSDYYGEPATFFYADRHLETGVVDPRAFQRALQRPSYDLPGASGPPPVWEAAPAPSCFILPKLHERYFPELAAYLRARYAARDRGKFSLFVLGRERGGRATAASR